MLRSAKDHSSFSIEYTTIKSRAVKCILRAFLLKRDSLPTAARSVLNGILKAFTRGQLLFKTIEIYDKYTLFSLFLFFEPNYSVTTQRNATVILLLPLYFKFSLSPATSFCLSALTFILIRKETSLHTATFFVLIRSVCNSTIYFLKRYVF